MADEYIKRQGLLDAYDAAHKGPPGGARKLIQEAPAEDVAPVVHGRWDVEVGMNWFKERICPVCKKHIESNFWNYCPNCGAKMEVRDG